MKWLRANPFVILLLPVLLGALFYTNWKTRQPAYSEQTPSFYIVHTLDYPTPTARGYKVEVRLDKALSDSLHPLLGKQLLLSLDSLADAMRPGTSLLIQCRLHQPSRQPLQVFNYAEYLRTQDISAIGKAVYCSPSAFSFSLSFSDQLRVRARVTRRWLVNHLSDACSLNESSAERGVLLSLVFGDRTWLDADTRQAYSAAGAMHVLAVSGLHVGLVWWLLEMLLTGFGCLKPLYEERWRHGLNALLIVVALWVYAFLTGLSASVMRAVLMLSLVEVGKACRRDSQSINIVCATAFFLLLGNPLLIGNVSFLLSFAAVIGIILFGGLWNKWLQAQPRYVSYPLGIFLVSVAAQLATLPISLYFFHQTSHYFFLANFVVIPAATLFMVLAFLTLLFCWCPIGVWLGTLLRWVVKGVNLCVFGIESLPGSVGHWSIGGTEVALFYVALFALYFALSSKVRWRQLMGWGTAFVAVVGVITIFLAKVQKEAATKQLVYCSSYSHDSVFMQDGLQTTLITTDSVSALRSVSDYCLVHHLSLPTIQEIAPHSFAFTYCNQRIFYVTGNFAHTAQWMDVERPNQVVLSPSLRPWLADDVVKVCEEKNIEVINLRNK